MLDKHWFAFFAMTASTVNVVAYVRSVLRGKLKPHVFSWFLWTLIMAIGCAAQYADGAGIGALPTAYSALVTLVIALFSLKYGEKNITRGDWISFLGALAAIPLWIATKNPLGAVILVSLIDATGFYPTVRKSWIKPRQESLLLFSLGGFVAGMVLMALENYTLVTVLYPATLILTHWGLAAMLIWRRAALKKERI